MNGIGVPLNGFKPDLVIAVSIMPIALQIEALLVIAFSVKTNAEIPYSRFS